MIDEKPAIPCPQCNTPMERFFAQGARQSDGWHCRGCKIGVRDETEGELFARQLAASSPKLTYAYFDGMSRERFDELRDHLPAGLGTYDEVMAMVERWKKQEP